MKHPVAAWTSTTSRTTPSSSSQPGSTTPAQPIREPDAMTLATATREGRPSARVVLLRGLDDGGVTFFTNRNVAQGRRARARIRTPPRSSTGGSSGARYGSRARVERDVRRGVARVLADAAARQPARRVGVAAVASTERSRRARGARRRDGGALRRGRRPAAALLGRLPPASRRRSSSGRTATTGCTTVSATSREGDGWRRERLAP